MGASLAQTDSPAKRPVLVLGDSLSVEYGLKRGTGWVALMEKWLVEEGMPSKIVNASISGDTTSGGRSRLPALLAEHKPALEGVLNDTCCPQHLEVSDSRRI